MQKIPFEQALKDAYGPVTQTYALKTEAILARLIKEEEMKVKRKLSTALAIALIIISLIGIALAATTQIFSLFSKNLQEDAELQAVNDAAEQTEQESVLQIADNMRFTITQSYYDQTQLYYAYKIDGAQMQPDYDYLPDESMLAQMTKLEPGVGPVQTAQSAEEISKRLKASGKAGWMGEEITLSDGLYTAGADLNILQSDEMVQDGVLLGYRKFEITDQIAQANPGQIALEQPVYRSIVAYYYEGSDLASATIYEYHSERQTQRIAFTAQRNQGGVHAFDFSRTYDNYAVTGTMKISPVNIQVDIAITGSDEWNKAMKNLVTMADAVGMDIVWEYELRVNGEKVESTDYAAYFGGLSVTFSRPKDIMLVELVPVYFQSGPNESERIIIDTAS